MIAVYESGNRRAWRLIRLLNGLALLAFIFLSSPRLNSQPAEARTQSSAGTANDLDKSVVLPKPLADPIEPVNRVIWAFNKGAMTYFVSPVSKAYRFVVIKPVRTSIGNFGRNISYPGRLINNLLQGRWKRAGQESERFLCNTVAGFGGFFDVATQWQIPKSDNDFGRTFAQWGWRPHFYLVLPILGPSNDRDGIGLLTDAAANPLTYFAPYAYTTYGTRFNNLTDTVDDYVRFNDSETDPYAAAHYAGTYTREVRPSDFRVKGEQDQASLETVESVFFTFQDPDFPTRGKTRAAFIPATGKKLKFTFWMQPKPAPIVYIVPGLGAHRLANTTLALAELSYKKGFSAVSVSSAFHPEFMENASTAALPAYVPVDTHDLHVALTEIDHQLGTRYPKRLGPRILLGYSLGAFHSLMIAANVTTNSPSLLNFDRCVAIDPPVRLMFGVSQLDNFFQAPLAWTADERTAAIENTFVKAASLIRTSPAPHSTPPFDTIESRFLIATAYRLSLRDVIFSSQQRNDQKILKHSVRNLRREPMYQEILQYSYQDYFDKFVVPYYLTRGVDLKSRESLERAGDLRRYSDLLKTNEKIRLLVNRNDILLSAEDVTWFEETFEPTRLALFQTGGHLGNLAQHDIQNAIIDAIEDRRISQPALVRNVPPVSAALADARR